MAHPTIKSRLTHDGSEQVTRYWETAVRRPRPLYGSATIVDPIGYQRADVERVLSGNFDDKIVSESRIPRAVYLGAPATADQWDC